MKISDIQNDIEESLANLRGVSLPPSLQGLRHLPVVDHSPEVSIRYRESRKIRGDADSSYFNPGNCELVISFSPNLPHDQPDAMLADSERDAVDSEPAALQLVEVLTETERQRPFVALKWFRDKVLPQSGRGWADEAHVRGAVLRHATDQRLVLTGHVPNPESTPASRNHRACQSAASSPAGTVPLANHRIRAGPRTGKGHFRHRTR